MANRLILFTRPECELCEHAVAMAAELDLPLEYADITGDIELLRRYREHIPVLQNPDTRSEIGWPFSVDQVQALAEES